MNFSTGFDIKMMLQTTQPPPHGNLTIFSRSSIWTFQKFLQLIKKCFPENHPLAKVVNKNNVIISYKTMPNLQKIISNHNRKILHPNKPRNKRPVDTTARATVFGRRKVNMQHYLCTFGNWKKRRKIWCCIDKCLRDKCFQESWQLIQMA